MEGKKPKDRPRMGMIEDIMMMGSYKLMKRRALDREGCRVCLRLSAMRQSTDDDDGTCKCSTCITNIHRYLYSSTRYTFLHRFSSVHNVIRSR